MAIPAGISTALVHMDAPVSFIGDVGRLHVTISPSASLVWAATGTPVGNFVDSLKLDPGQPLEIELPHTDQDGFLDSSGGAFKNWAYVIKVRYEKDGQTRTFDERSFQIPIGQTNVDLALIPAGMPTPPVSAPAASVTSLEGYTGAVTLEQLGVTGALAGKASIELPKHFSQDNILFVSTQGNDASDGRAPGSAKLTIMAAINTLAAFGLYGEVRVAPGTYVGDVMLYNGISLVTAGATIKATPGSTAKGVVTIAPGPVTAMTFEGFRIEGNGNAGQGGIYAEGRARPAPAYGDGGWWYSRIKDITIVGVSGRGIWLRGGGTTYMLPHQFLVFEMVRVFMDVAPNKEALVLSGQVGQIDFIQCEFDTYDAPPYGTNITVPNIYLSAQQNDNGTFADETNPYAITFHTPTIQGGWKAVYATHPCSGIIFTNPHLEGFKFGFHADTGAKLQLTGGGFDNVGGQGGGTGYWTYTTIGGQISWDYPAGGGARDKTFTSDTNMGSTTSIRNAPKSLLGTETSGLTKQGGVSAGGVIAMEGQKAIICTTSATAATNITSSAAQGESVFIEAFGGPLTFSTGSGLRLGGRSSLTIPDGSVAQFTRMDVLNNWVLVGHTPGATTSISANYTPVQLDRTILASGGAGGITVTLPVAPRGTRLDIKKTDSAAGAVTIAAGAGGSIEGAATLVLPNLNDSVALETNGTTWYVLAQMGRIRFRRGAGANALEVSNALDVLGWAFADQKLNGYASNGTSIRVTLDSQDTPTAGRFTSALFGSGKHISATNSGTEVFAVAADGTTTVGADVEVTNSAKGVILKSPNGTRWRLTVGDDGALSTTSL
jgi:hypothetical protein